MKKGWSPDLFPPNELASALAKLGLSGSMPVVVYGDADKSWGGEGWDVNLSGSAMEGSGLLKGGIQAWRRERLPIVKGMEAGARPKARYVVNPRPEIEISTEEIEADKRFLRHRRCPLHVRKAQR